MREPNEAVLFALGLAAFLFAVVLLLNLMGPTAVPVTREQFEQIKEADLIESMLTHSQGADWQLKRSVRVQKPGGDQVVERITLLEPDPAVIRQWRYRGGKEQVGNGDSRWGGLLIVLLIGVGLWHIWSQVQLDLKGTSPRRRLRQLEEELKQGEITEEEFRHRAEQIWPEL